MLSKRERELERAFRNWDRYSRSAEGVESQRFTLAQRCLDGTASDEEYAGLDECYARYDGVFTYVGPTFGPLEITGAEALVAWNRVTESQ